MTGPLADLIAEAEQVAVGPVDAGAAQRRTSLRTLVAMRLEAGAGAEVDDEEAGRLGYLAVLLAHIREREIGLRLLRDGAARAQGRTGRARLTALHGVLLAEAGRFGEARRCLEDALADAAGSPGDARPIHSNLAVLSGEIGDAHSAGILLGNAETQLGRSSATGRAAGDLTDPAVAFRHAFTRLRLALLREDADDAAAQLATLSAGCDEILRRLPGRHPSAVAAVADLAYATFRVGQLTDGPVRSGCVSVLRTAALLLGAGLGAEHSRTLTTRMHLAECELHLALERRDPAAAVRVLADARSCAAQTARTLGGDHPQATTAAAGAALAGLAVARSGGDVAGVATELAGVAAAATRILGDRHPLTALLGAESALADLAAAPAGSASPARQVEDRLRAATAGVAVVFGVRHSVARRLEHALPACPQTIDAESPVTAGTTRADTTRTDETRTEEARTDETPTGQTPTDETPTGQTPTDADVERRTDDGHLWADLERTRQEGGALRGPVVEVVKGGLVLDVGVRAFLPASLVELRRVRDLQPYLGRELEAKILELDRTRGNLVLSRRARLEETRSQDRSELLGHLHRGQIRRGIVSSVVNFGAFVDLGGVDGLISTSELSWAHHNHPSEVVEVGQEVEVEVLEIDQDRGRISLSLKATQQDPWPLFARVHPIGQIVTGRITKLMPFGAFVRVDGLEGLVHVSELADRHVDSPDQVVRAGTDVLVKVTDIDLQRRRLSLSLKQANAEFVEDEAQFDPATYGMVNTYDADGNYVYPEGFDPDSAEWLPGFEEQQQAWEQAYAEARDRWEAHGRQVRAARGNAPDVEDRLSALRQRLSNGSRTDRRTD